MSSDFPIDPTSFSFSDIQANLDIFLSSQPDADQWSQFFQSTSGRNVRDLVAAFGALMRYDTITARREAYIQFSQNRSSKIGASQFLGYSVFRGRNAVLKLTIIPISTGVYEKYDIIGTVKDRDLILLESYAYNAGVPLEVSVVVGQILTETLIASSDRLNVFHFTQKAVSNDARIFIDGTEVAWSTNVADMLSGKFQLQSNPFGSVDAKFLNLSSFSPRYQPGSEILLQWVTLKDIEFVLSDVALDETDGTLSALEFTSFYEAPETDSSIEVNAPLKNETKGHVRGKQDQPKLFRQLDTAMISTSGKTIKAAVMEIYYIKDDGTRYSPEEKLALVEAFEPYRPHGLLPLIISEPDEVDLHLSFQIVRDPTGVGDHVALVDSILAPYENLLEAKFNLYDIEQQIESADYVKIVRISVTAPLWGAETLYALGKTVSDAVHNDVIYKAKNIIYLSGASEPVWTNVAGQLILDGRLIWESFYKSDVSELHDWEPSTRYSKFDVVRPTVANDTAYKVVGYLNFTGAVEPVWTPLSGAQPEDFVGTLVEDNNILWMAVQQEGTPPTWQLNTDYKAGEIVVASNQVGSDTVGVAWQVLAFLGKTGASLPAFPPTPSAVVTDGSIEWEAVDITTPDFSLPVNQFYKFVKTVTVE